MKLFIISLFAAFIAYLPQPSPRFQAKQAAPDTQLITIATVGRSSAQKDQHGSYLPPWDEVKIANFFSKAELNTGSEVTVIPLGVDIATFNLKIVKVEKQRYGCDEGEPNAWEVELEPILDRQLFEIEPLPNRRTEVPFDVCIIFPALPMARQLRDDHVARGMLPKGVSINTVRAAIDVTNDQQPDVVIAEVCCNDASKSEGCDYTCGKTFLKLRGKWKLVDEYAPC
jgi:hypothetical protein